MRALGWYVAALLAAYSMSTSWSLGAAADRVTALQQQDVQLATDLDTKQSELAAARARLLCAVEPDACYPD